MIGLMHVVTGKGIEHIGIAHLEGQRITGAQGTRRISHIHNGMVAAVADHLDTRQLGNHHTGIAHILAAEGKNGTQAAAFILDRKSVV